jgi:hypothetical protein
MDQGGTMENGNELALLGVSAETQRAIEAWTVGKPPTKDQYENTETVTVELTVGQVQVLRGYVRSAALDLLAKQAIAGMLAEAAHTDFDQTVTKVGVPVEEIMQLSVQAETALAEAVAEHEAEALDFQVPDTLPDGFESWDD